MDAQLEPWRRSPDDRMIAGVCGSLARRLDIDPTLVRVAAVTLALSGGVGLVLYALCWLLLPTETGPSPLRAAFPHLADVPAAAWWAVAIVACLVVSILTSTLLPFGTAGAVVLLALAWAWYRHAPTAGPGNSRPEITDPAPAELVGVTAARSPRTTIWPWELATIVLAGLAIVPFAVWAHVHGQGLSDEVAIGTMVAVMGAGLILLSFRGRPWILGIVTLASVLSLGLAVAAPSLPRAHHHADFASDTQIVAATTTSDIRDVAIATGDIDADYSRLHLDRDATVTLSSTAGDVRITLPADANAVVEWSLGMGDYAGPDGRHEGLNHSGTYAARSVPGTPTLTIVVRSRVGDIEVRPA